MFIVWLENFQNPKLDMKRILNDKNKIFMLHEINYGDDGKPMRHIYPEVSRAWIEKLKEVTLTGDSSAYEGYAKLMDQYVSMRVYSPQENQFVTVITDVSEITEVNQNILKKNEFLETMLLSVSDGFISTDLENKVTMMNYSAEKMTGWTQDEAYGKQLAIVFKMVGKEPEGETDIPESQYIAKEKFLIDRFGNMIAIEESTTPIMNGSGKAYGKVIMFRDISEENYRIRHIEYLSYHDQLTGLYNRRFFDEEMKRIDTERNLPISLVMIDVNGLKLTNDAFGHQMGDRLLKKIADILKLEFRADDIIARIGGDEFAVILPNTRREEVLPILERVQYAADHAKFENIYLSFSAGSDTKAIQYENIMEVFIRAENEMYRNKLTESKMMRNRTVQLIIEALSEKCVKNCINHSEVTHWCTMIGKELNLTQEELDELDLVALIYDIGKISISDELLSKPEKLTESEYEKIRRHPEVGYQILKSVDQYANIAEYALSYHEKWDGSGYPRKLRGEQIPRFARIIAIVDTYEALISERPYRRAMLPCDALEFIKSKSGIEFDPEIVKVFIRQLEQKENC